VAILSVKQIKKALTNMGLGELREMQQAVEKAIVSRLQEINQLQEKGKLK
jgi:hypothetical protein